MEETFFYKTFGDIFPWCLLRRSIVSTRSLFNTEHFSHAPTTVRNTKYDWPSPSAHKKRETWVDWHWLIFPYVLALVLWDVLYTYTYIHTYIHLYIYMWLCVCVYICVCLFDLQSHKMHPGTSFTELRTQTFMNPRPSAMFFAAHIYICATVWSCTVETITI